MDAAALQQRAAELGSLVADLVAEKQDTPEVLVNPSLEKAKQCHKELLDLAAEAKQQSGLVAGSEAEELDAKAADISALVAAWHEQLEARPWLDPPKLRKMRQTGEVLAQSVADLRRLRREALGRSRAAVVDRPLPVRREAPVATYAPGMAGGALVESGARLGSGDGPMDVDQALAMLLDKKQGGYRGGLCGIVHAAGVQEMVPIPAHSPAKFEFVFAPKSSAAFNLHQFSAMI